MNKNSIEHYLPLTSLFKPTNKKTISSHAKPTEYLNNTTIPNKTQYTPPNPTHFKLKETQLCRSCHDKKNSSYTRQRLKLDELQGVQRNLSQTNKLEPVSQHRQIFASSSRPPNYIEETTLNDRYISKTLAIKPNNYSTMERSTPPPVYLEKQPTQPINPLEIPIPQQEHNQEETIKEGDLFKNQKEKPKQDELKDQEEDLNILINSQVPLQQKTEEEIIEPSTPPFASPTPNQNLHPSYRNFTMQKTQSNYFTDTVAKEQAPQQIIKPSHQLKKDTSIYRATPHHDNDFQETHAKIIRKSSHFQRIAPVSSVASKSDMGVNTVRDTMLNYMQSAVERDAVSDSDYKQKHNDKQAFFNSTKRDTNRYIENIRGKLSEAYLSLQQAQRQIDGLVQKNLQLQCQKIKCNLYRAIEIELNDFKDSQRKKLSSSKFSYLSDLYELKCNIDLRLQELQEYQIAFKSQYKWKNVVGDLLTPDYQSTIHFLVNKSAQTQEDCLMHTQKFLADYNNKMFVEVLDPLKKEIKLAIENLFLNFNRLREKKMSYRTFMRKYYEDETINT